MKKITLTLVLILLVGIQLVSANEKYKRVSITNHNQKVLHELDAIGADISCSAEFNGEDLIIELYEYQLEILCNKDIEYEVIIDDMQAFYSKRAVEDLPKASAEIERLKKTQRQSIMQESNFQVTELFTNIGQYTGEDEIDWTIPQNWNINDVANYPSESTFFGGCLTYDQVLDELDDMRQYSIDNNLNIISARTDASPTGQKTIEGRTIWMMRISDNPDVNEPNEPETLYQSLIHSRESATIMSQLYFMWYILENYNSDPAIRYLVNNQELYFIPVFNPDGFVYNETVAPNGGGGQRKNRNVGSNSCSTYANGIDLNRNSAYYWGNGGSELTNACSGTYAGTGPFSENETQIMRDFFNDNHNFKIALNHHSFRNTMLHAYAGTNQTNPRPDEYSKYNHDMTFYNRYGHGPSTSISSLNSGNMNDWMLGGPAGTSAAGVPTGTGSGQHTMAWTPENGSGSGTETTGGTYGGFWPQPSAFLQIAQRAMRMNFLAAYYSGKYAKVHDLTQNDITTTTGNLTFGLERLGQEASDFTVTVAPVSSNITINTSAITESFINGANPNFPVTETNPIQVELEQRELDFSYTLDPTIQIDDEITYKVTLTSNYASDNVLYDVEITKRYNPSIRFSENLNPTNLNNWTDSNNGISWATTTDAFPPSASGRAITSTLNAPYSNGENKTLTLNNAVNLSNDDVVLIQYHAKWDLERSFDYVQIEGSTNGTTWTPLVGNLTKKGFLQTNNQYTGKSNDTFQPNGEPLYDGDTQDRWNFCLLYTSPSPRD